MELRLHCGFARGGGRKELTNFFRSLILETLDPENFVTECLVRSNHPQEDCFSDGAFESDVAAFRLPDTVDGLNIFDEWGESGKPVLNDAKMAALMTEVILPRVERVKQKIIAMANPELNLRVARDLRHRGIKGYRPEDMQFLLNQRISGQRLVVVPLANGNIDIRYENEEKTAYENIEVNLNQDGFSEQLVEVFGKKMAREIFVGIKKAQTVFRSQQEFELVGGAFVQAKPVVPETIQNTEIPDDLFNQGLKTYRNRMGLEEELIARRIRRCDEMRDAQAIIVDEESWHDLNSEYAKLFKLATEYENYILIVRDISKTEDHHVFEQLLANATVVCRGAENSYAGRRNESHITVGTKGPKQITVLHYDNNKFPGTESHFWKKIGAIKNGDLVSVMIKNHKVSILHKISDVTGSR